jgi:tetratricopeptide (TPR) repeat protein
MNNLAFARSRSGQGDSALALLQEVVAIATRKFGPDNPNTLAYRRTYAGLLINAKRLSEGLPLAEENLAISRRLLGPENPQTLVSAEMLGTVFGQAGRLAEAEATWREVFELRRKTDPKGWRVAFAASQLGKVLVLAHRPAEAEPLLRSAYDTLVAQRPTLPATRRRSPEDVATQLVLVYTALGRPAEATEWQAKSVAKP